MPTSTKCPKIEKKVTINVIQHDDRFYDIYDCFTMEHFRLRQRMTLTIKIYCSRLYLPGWILFVYANNAFRVLSLVPTPRHRHWT
jgi:hypothetical protein